MASKALRICETPGCGCIVDNMNPKTRLCDLCRFTLGVQNGSRCPDCGERTIARVDCSCKIPSRPAPTFAELRYQEEGR